jgi:hypothetical protein
MEQLLAQETPQITPLAVCRWELWCTDVFDREGFERLEAHGVGDVLVQPWLFYGAGMRATLGEKRDGLRRFADDVLARSP